MFLSRNIRCIASVVRNVAAKNGGYVLPTRTAAFKSDLKIKWVRPEKIPSIDPRKSCDGGLDLKVTPQDYSNFFDKSKELQDADEIVKKMFTLEYLPQRETWHKKRDITIAKVRRHKADRGSMESRIAMLTGKILNLQDHMKVHPRNRRIGHFLKELIDKRKKFLGILRRWDYKRFEWILEKMNLVYKPHPPRYGNVTRKRSMRKLTTIHCHRLRQAKLKQYERELKIEKRSFIVEKAEKLEFIRNEEIACGKEPTVTEEEIAAAKMVVEKSRRRGIRRAEKAEK